MNHTRSAELFERNARYIPGGTVSLNRKVEPEIAFVRGQGAYLWDVDGNRYVDYHAGFAPYLLGHADPDVEGGVQAAMRDGWTLAGSGTTPWEGQAAELLVRCVPNLEKVQFTTTGSEATYHALRLSRAFTGRDHVVVMQGGYNGWHDEVACNVMTPLDKIGPKVSQGEYPMVPGHEIVGIVTDIGSEVSKFSVGDSVGIGCLVDSCRECDNCKQHLEQYCLNGASFTYFTPDRHGDGIIPGGYSNQIVCDEDFVLKVADHLPLEGVAPLLCAGITTFSPLRRWNIGAGQQVAIVGLGGLGHMGVKLAAAMGAEVTVLSTSPSKQADAFELGAHNVAAAVIKFNKFT